MENSISIPSSHIKYLIPGYRQRLSEIERSIKELENEKIEINKIIGAVDQEITPYDETIAANTHSTAVSEYNRNASWFSKAKFILQKAGKPLTTAQIVDEIMSSEPNLNNRTLIVRNISSILGVKSKDGKEIEKFKIEGKDQKFGLK
jgi:hypothetical protein